MFVGYNNCGRVLLLCLSQYKQHMHILHNALRMSIYECLSFDLYLELYASEMRVAM